MAVAVSGGTTESKLSVGRAMRLLIAGVPSAGKTTLAGEVGGRVIHTDDYIELGWSESSLAVSHLFDEEGPWVIEGVIVPRALRKWLGRNEEGKPADRVIFLNDPRQALSKGRAGMAKGCRTVWLEVVGELRGRGVKIEER